MDEHRTAPASRVAAFLDETRGVSTIEFGLIAPMIFFGFLSVVDIGRAVTERLALSTALRSGAQAAMSDPGVAAVQRVIEYSDQNNATATERSAPTVSISRYCACPSNSNLQVACTSTCTSATPAGVYYNLAASATFDGFFLPRIQLSNRSRVRVK